MCQSPTERHIKLSIQSFLAAQWIDSALCKMIKSTVIVMLSAARGLALVAIDGNSLIRDKNHMTIFDQCDQAAMTTHHIADMIRAG